MTILGTGLEDVVPASEDRRRRWTSTSVSLTVGLGLVAALYLVSAFAPMPFSPTQPDTGAISLAPSPSHIFGTDATGFDVFSRTIASAGTDLPLAVGGTLLAFLIGVPLGLLASSESWGANALMRGVDALQALPLLIISVAVVTLAGNHAANVVFAIVLVLTPGFIRLVRSGALVIRQSRYVEAAIAIGCSKLRVLRVHVFPNVLNLVLVQCSISIGQAVVVIAALNFLGVGVTPPKPTWGSMIAEGAAEIGQGYWWVTAFPALAVLLVVVSFNMVARSLDELTRTH